MNISYKDIDYNFSRYPATSNRSLQPWSALDGHLLNYAEQVDIKENSTVIYNDRFGVLACLLHTHLPFSIFNYKSQEKAHVLNFEENKLDINREYWLNPLSEIPSTIEMGLIKIPKSMDLFRLQLFQLSKALSEDGVVFCSFMTKYFSPQMIKIANQFFEVVEQSKAWKKSRVIILQKKKPLQEISLINKIPFEEHIYQQYFGVFSAKNIDVATQFFIEVLQPQKGTIRVLDLASGNGVLGHTIQFQNPLIELHLLDDSFLAIESSKLNVKESSCFHYNDSMENLDDEYFDLIVSNPPFHFENETNIEVAIGLFEEVERCLKKDGKFQLVASRHLNFHTHLIKIFADVTVIGDDEKFEVYECVKVLS